MRVNYTGVSQLPPKIQNKVNTKFAKLSKLVDGRGEREAHVIVTQVRHLNRAEVTMQFYDHKLVGMGSDSDLFTALLDALDKLEKQAVTQTKKWREKTRRKESPKYVAAAEPKAAKNAPKSEKSPKASNGAKRVFRVNQIDSRKPMTLDEAVLELDNKQDYLVYRDADNKGLSVLVRRKDGHFDLIES